MRLLFLACCVVYTAGAHAQTADRLNASARLDVVQAVSEQLLHAYVLPAVGHRMSDRILQEQRAGKYDAITDPVAFADALTGALQQVQSDGHLQLRYVPAAGDTTPMPARGDPRARIHADNFGLRRVEVLTGNIGYIGITHFWADSPSGRASVKAALQLVSHTHALIIDLRTCGGGSQDAVRDLAGFFFAEPTHLNDMYDRRRNDTTAYWTRPDTAFAHFAALPLFILTSRYTFSAAEEFCYDLQVRGRATLIGERTGGGAHGMDEVDVGHGIVLSLPYCEAVNPITHGNWEGTGVTPEVQVDAEQALGAAELRILDQRLAVATEETERFNLAWDRDLVQAATTPVQIDVRTLQEYAGVYGDRTFTLEDGRLFYQRTGRPKFELEAMSPTTMKARDNGYFKIVFIRNAAGLPYRVDAYYQDGRVETSTRTAP